MSRGFQICLLAYELLVSFDVSWLPLMARLLQLNGKFITIDQKKHIIQVRQVRLKVLSMCNNRAGKEPNKLDLLIIRSIQYREWMR